MADPAAFGKLPSGDPPPPETPIFDRSMARLARLAALAMLFVIISGLVYSDEGGASAYVILVSIPYVIFMVARTSRKWQAWGWALACVTITLALVPTVVTVRSIMHRAHRSTIGILIFLMALLLTQAAQLMFVRRASAGKFVFGTPLLRCVLYDVGVLLFVGVTLPSWYVPMTVRHENSAVTTLRSCSNAMEIYASQSKDANFPTIPSALAIMAEAGKMPPSGRHDYELTCAQTSCVKNGYRFEYRPVSKDGRVTSYTISARPLEFEETGNRSFLLTADGTIRQTREDRDALPTDEPH